MSSGAAQFYGKKLRSQEEIKGSDPFILHPFVDVLPSAENYACSPLQVVEAWGLDAETFLEEVLQTLQGEKE